MTSESGFWSVVRQRLSPYGRLQRIESHLTAQGIPDVVYSLLGHSGWLELKHLAAWPKRPTTPLHVPHLKLEQVLFLEDWERHPSRGRAHGLFQVADDYLLLAPAWVRRVHERSATRTDLLAHAAAHGAGSFPTVAVVRALTKNGLHSGANVVG